VSSVADFYIDVDGVQTYVTEVGAGPTVVLLHGAAVGVDSTLTWCRTMRALSDQFRLIAFDQIGFGRTDMPNDGVYKNRLERTDHVRSTLRELEVTAACLVGHSEGAFIAARLAITDPDLLRSLVIVTSGGTAPYLGDPEDEKWISACEEAYNDPQRLTNEEAFIQSDAHLSRGKDPEYETILRRNFEQATKSGQIEIFQRMPEAEVDYQQYRELQETHVLPYLSEIDIPSLLIWADDDPTVPVSRGHALWEQVPAAEMQILGNAGHYVMHDQTETFNGIIRSFAGVQP
jgi:pimeloyl-ACP methyl ester carboxylesterase